MNFIHFYAIILIFVMYLRLGGRRGRALLESRLHMDCAGGLFKYPIFGDLHTVYKFLVFLFRFCSSLSAAFLIIPANIRAYDTLKSR